MRRKKKPKGPNPFIDISWMSMIVLRLNEGDPFFASHCELVRFNWRYFMMAQRSLSSLINSLITFTQVSTMLIKATSSEIRKFDPPMCENSFLPNFPFQWLISNFSPIPIDWAPFHHPLWRVTLLIAAINQSNQQQEDPSSSYFSSCHTAPVFLLSRCLLHCC